MELRRRPRALGLAAALLVALVVAPGVRGDARDLYKDGLDARERGDHVGAERAFRAAIEERREEKSGWRSYFPFYYLGVTLAEQEDCAGALLAFGESERQGQIRDAADEYADLVARREACHRHLERVESLTSAATAELAAAEEAEASVTSLSRLPQLQERWAAELAADEQAAATQLAAARAALGRGRDRHDPEALELARRHAAEAARGFESVATAARERLRGLDRAAADALGELEEVEGSLRRILRSITDLQPYPPGLAARVAEAEAALTESTAVGSEVQPGDLAGLKDRLTVAMSRLRRAAQRPPQDLVGAVEAFLAGDYQATLARLEEVELGEARARAQACLLRGAAEHALYVLGGEREPDRLAAATAAIEACGALDPVPAPPERFFSPRFRALYQATLAAGDADAAGAE